MYTDERHFVKTVNQQILLLQQIWALEPEVRFEENEKRTRDVLGLVKSSALIVHARGIYRAASLCEDVLTRTGTDCLAKLGAALTSLKHLVTQYTDGLLEIDPDYSWQSIPEQKSVLKTEDPIVVTQEDLKNAHKTAVDTLTPLLKYVGNPDHEKALSLLMRPISIETSSAIITENATVSFDVLMHPLNNLILGEARHCGKAVSISYASDFTRVDRNDSDRLRNLLEVICLNIVANGIGPEQSTPTQISITGQQKSGALEFTIGWRGEALSELARRMPHFSKVLNQLETRGGQVTFNSAVLADTGEARHTISLVWPIMATAMTSMSATKHIKSGEKSVGGGV